MSKMAIHFVALAVLILLTSAGSLAQSPYFVLTNDEGTNNSGSVFNLNPDGSLTEVATLETGGESLGGGFYGGQTQVISPGAACIFIADGGGADIAAFSAATSYSKVGNYSNSVLGGGTDMPMVVNSAGTLLYAAYELTSNIGVWTVNSDCSLTLANVYKGLPFIGSLVITHDQQTLLVSYEIVRRVGSYTISGSTLSFNGAVSTGTQDVSQIAVTDDDQVVVMGTAYSTKHPANIITANLPGFTNMQTWTVGPGWSAGSIALSADAAAGNGCMYVGNTGGGHAKQSGVTGVMFTESPLNLTYVNRVVSPQADSLGNIVTISNTGNGRGVFAAESVGDIGVYAADSSCTVSLVKENPDPNSTFLLSLTSWAR
jgi:hypothetical protein